MHAVVFVLFLSVRIRNSLSLTQTLTTSDENIWVNNAKITNLSPSTILTHTNWHVTANQDHDQWGLWLKTNLTWGFHSSLPSSFSIQLSGRTNSGPSDLLISLSDGADTKYATILIRLNGQNEHWIAPGCDSVDHPTQTLISGDVYLAMADEPTPGTRMCRAAYIDVFDTCSYTTFGPDANVIWPMTFTIHNYPTIGNSIITFESDGYSPISCGFSEAFLPNIGTNIWITSLVGDDFEISSITLEYTLEASVSSSTSIPTTMLTMHPTKLPTKLTQTYNPTHKPTPTTETQNLSSTTTQPTTEPTTEPTVRPTLQLFITDNPTTEPTLFILISRMTTDTVFNAPHIGFWERNLSLIVLITISVGMCMIIVLCAATISVFMYKCCCRKRRRYTHDIVVFDEPSTELSHGKGMHTEFERQNAIAQHMEMQRCLSPTPRSILTDATDTTNEVDTEEKASPVEKVRRFDFEGPIKTIPEMDEIDRLYGRPGHVKQTKSIHTDIESMYGGAIGGTVQTAVGEGMRNIVEEKSDLYDGSSGLDGIETQTVDTLRMIQVSKSGRLLHDTHGTSIELSSRVKNVYADNESKEEYYIDDEEDTDHDIDDDVLMSPQVTAMSHRT